MLLPSVEEGVSPPILPILPTAPCQTLRSPTHGHTSSEDFNFPSASSKRWSAALGYVRVHNTEGEKEKSSKQWLDSETETCKSDDDSSGSGSRSGSTSSVWLGS